MVDGDTKEFEDIKDKDEEMYADTTMDVEDVDLVVETTKVPLVTKVDTTTTIIVALVVGSTLVTRDTLVVTTTRSTSTTSIVVSASIS